jgi:hypothetical protein
MKGCDCGGFEEPSDTLSADACVDYHGRPVEVRYHVESSSAHDMVLVRRDTGGTVLDLTPAGARRLAALLLEAAGDRE